MLFRNKRPRLKLVNFKVTAEELELIRENAKRFAKGNMSAWVRLAAIQARPTMVKK